LHDYLVEAPSMVTQREIALALGLSPSTVSRALADDPRISEETRARVEEAVKRLRYQPNLLASSFRRGITNTIGLVVMDITNPFYSELARGVEDLAYNQGFSIILGDSDVREEREALYLEWLCSRRVDGILMTPINEDAASRAMLVEGGVPYVLVDAGDATDNASVVTVDHDKGAYLAVQHLLSLGHTRIAFVGGDLHISPVRRMFSGFRRALAEAGLKVETGWVCEETTEMHGGYVAVQKLLDQRNRPTAALFISDLTAIAAMSALEEHGLRVPEDFSIVGYDNIQMGALVKPALTTVAQDQYQLGQISTRILIHEIRSGTSKIHQRVLLQPRLVVRASSGR
jgi:LacI family transcriptional regulator, galactose operon repressor